MNLVSCWGAWSVQVWWAAKGCNPKSKILHPKARGPGAVRRWWGRGGSARSGLSAPLSSLGLCSCNGKAAGSPRSRWAQAWLLAPACPARPTLHAAHPSATLTGGNAPSGWGHCGNSTSLHQTCGCKSHVRDSATAGMVAGLFQLGAKLSLLGEIQRRDAEWCLSTKKLLFYATSLYPRALGGWMW